MECIDQRGLPVGGNTCDGNAPFIDKWAALQAELLVQLHSASHIACSACPSRRGDAQLWLSQHLYLPNPR